MTRTRRALYGKGMATVAFLLFLVALGLSGHKYSAAYWFMITGLVFFGGGAGLTLPWRDMPPLARISVLIGSLLLTLGAVWPWVYKEPWTILLSNGVAVIASVLALLGSWAYLAAALEWDD